MTDIDNILKSIGSPSKHWLEENVKDKTFEEFEKMVRKKTFEEFLNSFPEHKRGLEEYMKKRDGTRSDALAALMGVPMARADAFKLCNALGLNIPEDTRCSQPLTNSSPDNLGTPATCSSVLGLPSMPAYVQKANDGVEPCVGHKKRKKGKKGTTKATDVCNGQNVEGHHEQSVTLTPSMATDGTTSTTSGHGASPPSRFACAKTKQAMKPDVARAQNSEPIKDKDFYFQNIIDVLAPIMDRARSQYGFASKYQEETTNSNELLPSDNEPEDKALPSKSAYASNSHVNSSSTVGPVSTAIKEVYKTEKSTQGQNKEVGPGSSARKTPRPDVLGVPKSIDLYAERRLSSAASDEPTKIDSMAVGHAEKVRNDPWTKKGIQSTKNDGAKVVAAPLPSNGVLDSIQFERSHQEETHAQFMQRTTMPLDRMDALILKTDRNISKTSKFIVDDDKKGRS